MLKQTLDSVAALNYPNFECVVIINNTPDPAFVKPIEEHCKRLGAHFKFVNVEKLEGFKAGALRVALQHTAPDAEVIGLLDADYVVSPDWLSDLAPLFSDPRVGLVQAPQDHRDGHRSIFQRHHERRICRLLRYRRHGGAQRDQRHRRPRHDVSDPPPRAGRSRRLVERHHHRGYRPRPVDPRAGLDRPLYRRRYGHGMLPDDYRSFKTQRHRWAYGGFQIAKKHWRRFAPGGTRLTLRSARAVHDGWINWMGAEALGVAAAILNLLWVPVVAFGGIALPDSVLTLPVVVVFLINIIHFALL